ncbi:MAG: lactate dehydrogenase [Clostridiaceae bacterium]
MEFYRYRDCCFCPAGGTLPKGAEKIESPSDPLVFLVYRDPLNSRGFFAISDLAERDEPEGANLLLPFVPADQADETARFVRLHGASVVNTAFARWFDVLSAFEARQNKKNKQMRFHLIGLGDVGGTVLTGLKLLGTDLGGIGIFDPDESRMARYEAELNQILPITDGAALPEVSIVSKEALFDCDVLLFTASRGVPPVGEEGADVRMSQYKANRDMLRAYAVQARESGFTGLFAQVSDPVDQLSRAVFLLSNQNERGEFDWAGLLPEQVRGFGLGVMRARAEYTSKREGISAPELRAFGPHGQGLVIANAPDSGYDDALSRRLTQATVEANLQIRKLGYKPYIAPGLSSAAISVLRMARGEWHDAAVPLGGAYFGCRTRLSGKGSVMLREPLDARLFERVRDSYNRLKEFNTQWAD